MAKRPNSPTPKQANVKKTLHLDVLADGVLDGLSVLRQKTVSAIVCELLLAELHNTQGNEREAIRAILTARGIDIPRKKSGTSDAGRAVGGLPESVDQADGVLTRNSKVSDITAAAHAPVDDGVESLSDDQGELPLSLKSRTARFSGMV
jgi:hypothetical protein